MTKLSYIIFFTNGAPYGQSPTFPTIKPIKIYTFRILYSCQLSCIMRESCGQLCGLRAKDIDLTLEEQFLTLDSQVWNT